MLFDKTEKTKRPYWHVDAKWVCALLLALLLAVTLPVISLYRLTCKEPATKIMTYTFAGMTSPDGIDSESGLDEIKQRVLQNGSETITTSGIKVTFTANDVNTLSPRELRLKAFGDFASRFYDQGAKGFAKSQGFDEAAASKFEKDSAAISVLTLSTHKFVGNIMIVIVIFDLLLAAGVVFFSHRFGRLVSLGTVLLLVGLPGVLLSIISSSHSTVAGTARTEVVSSGMDMIGNLISYISPLVVPYFASTYLASLFSGVGILLIATIGRIVYTIVQKYRKGV
jgi:hypothetical protein